tara:strand:- start:196 stop:1086 length:891 start_codon:yes stop_codon:yes gene_type:complete
MVDNIFDIIRKERINIYEIDTHNINNVFFNFYYKYMFLIKKKLMDQTEIIFEDEIDIIGNMFFHISWIILLTSFNIHITLFFMERAALLFSEFILISSTEMKYTLETNTKINDAIIFTYRKTVGDTVLSNILKENESIKNNTIYKSLFIVRTNNYIYIKIINHILKLDNFKSIEKYIKIAKHLIDPIYNIYQTIDIDTYLYPKILKILNEEYSLTKSLFLIKINVEVIDIFLSEYFFNNLEKEIDFFLENLDKKYNEFHKSIESLKYINNQYNLKDIHNNKLFINFKNRVFKFMED